MLDSRPCVVAQECISAAQFESQFCFGEGFVFQVAGNITFRQIERAPHRHVLAQSTKLGLWPRSGNHVRSHKTKNGFYLLFRPDGSVAIL